MKWGRGYCISIFILSLHGALELLKDRATSVCHCVGVTSLLRLGLSFWSAMLCDPVHFIMRHSGEGVFKSYIPSWNWVFLEVCERDCIFILTYANLPLFLLYKTQQWERNLEKFHMDLFRMRCYLASLQGGELPNPKSLLAATSRPSKLALGRLGILSVSSFHALVSPKGGCHRTLQRRSYCFPCCSLVPSALSAVTPVTDRVTQRKWKEGDYKVSVCLSTADSENLVVSGQLIHILRSASAFLPFCPHTSGRGVSEE